MSSRDGFRNLTVKKIPLGVLKGAFVLCEISNILINLRNKKDISDRELRRQFSDLIKTCTESLVFLGMANMKVDNIRRQYLSNQIFSTRNCSP